jgi:hypothetical protein
MTLPFSTVDYASRRIRVALPRPYDEARRHYEQLVPAVDTAAFSQAGSWGEVLEVVKTNAPNGFMLYYRGDVSAAVAGSSSHWRATQYLMGNHTIAETMFRHDPSVMVYAPLRTLIYVDPDGVTRFAVDQPSLQFGSFGDPRIAEVGLRLDALVAQLVTLLGADLPPALRGHAGAIDTSR